ncbi:MAG TPA: SDR family NAD(P)-dependent oxidoreductase [Acetobacteraceae bacterium]|nr:SDR family NAD(P)-dependent oxidoreductase [Acetobacteraceae bacterium]
MSIADVSDRSIATLISLAGRTAIVTGGAWGLGKATARRLAEAGAAVLIGDIDMEKAAATASEISEACGGARVGAINMDVADSDTIIAAANLAVRELGGIDIWVNNAGVASNTPLLDMTDPEWDRVMAVNLRGLFVGAREAARRMIAAGKGGVIVNLASLAGFMGIAPGQAAYVTSKHGVRGATRQMALELAPHGIRVLAVAPGYCQTEHTAHLASMDPELLKQIPIPGIAGSKLGRVGAPDDIARVILFCASDLSIFMTGSTLLVDGGEGS